MKQLSVSVVLSVRNGERHLAQALDSVLACFKSELFDALQES